MSRHSKYPDARSTYDKVTDSSWFLAVAYFVVAVVLFLLSRAFV